MLNVEIDHGSEVRDEEKGKKQLDPDDEKVGS